MDLSTEKVSRKQFWMSHIKASEQFDGTITEYCKLHGLKPGSLSGYKTKLGLSKSRPKKTKSSGFSQVKITDPVSPKPKSSMPDPKWLAEFLKAWEALT